MTHFNFLPKPQDEEMVVTFGNAEKQVTIDISFIPSGIGFAVKQLMDSNSGMSYPPETLAKMICLFTQDVDEDWLVNNCEYGVLDQICAMIASKSFNRRAEKN